MRTIDLVKAGAELNYELGLLLPIDIYNSSYEDLQEAILDASELVLGRDCLTKETKEVIDYLKLRSKIEGRKRKETKTASEIKFKDCSFKITSSSANEVIIIESNQVISIVPLSNKIIEISSVNGKH